jgi:hypothetical protein
MELRHPQTASLTVRGCRSPRIPVLVRVAVDQMGWIPRYLDAGADGIVLAMTGTSPDAGTGGHRPQIGPRA